MQAAQGAAQGPIKTTRQRRSSSRIQLWAEARLPRTTYLSPSSSGKNIQVEALPLQAEHSTGIVDSCSPTTENEQPSQGQADDTPAGSDGGLTRGSSGMWTRLGTRVSAVLGLAAVGLDTDMQSPRRRGNRRLSSLSSLPEAQLPADEVQYHTCPQEGGEHQAPCLATLRLIIWLQHLHICIYDLLIILQEKAVMSSL